MKQEIQTCYITAPSGAKLDTLLEVLQKHGIRVVTPNLEVGADIATSIATKISNADLVIGVLTSKRNSQWVLFELGQAAAFGCRLLLIAPPKTELPFNASEFQVVRTGLSNFEALDFAIAQVKVAPRSTITAETAKPRTAAPDLSTVDFWLDELNQIQNQGNERDLEEFVSRILRDVGVTFVKETPTSSRRVDFAIWSDWLQRSVGNPLLVEVKKGSHDRKLLRHAADQLSSAVTASGAYWGLLIYANDYLDRSKTYSTVPPNVLVISLHDLLTQLRERPFESVVTELRNERVHGVSRDARY